MSMSNTNESQSQPGVGDVRENLSSDIEQIKKLGEERLDDLRELGGQIRRRVEDEIKNRPIVALGAAFGAGVLVSSLMSSRIARLAILAAGGYAAREMFGDRLMDILGPEDEGSETLHQPRGKKNKGQRVSGGGGENH